MGSCVKLFLTLTAVSPSNRKQDSSFTQTDLLDFLHIPGFPGGSNSKSRPAMLETGFQSLGWEDLLEKKMVTHSSILAWRIPWTEEPVGYSSQGCKESDKTEMTQHVVCMYLLYMSYSTKPLQSQCIKSANSIGTKIKNVYEGLGMLNLGNQGFDIIRKNVQFAVNMLINKSGS